MFSARRAAAPFNGTRFSPDFASIAGVAATGAFGVEVATAPEDTTGGAGTVAGTAVTTGWGSGGAAGGAVWPLVASNCDFQASSMQVRSC